MPTTHHTQGTVACQQPPVLAADKRLILRYGAAALADGYAAIPRVVIRHRHALGITASEWDYLCELWSYWHSTAGPCPAVETLARGLGVDQSTIRRHRASLEQKGLLRVTLDGAHNRYDLSPLIAAAVGLDRLQQERSAAVAGPCIVAEQERAELHAEQEVEKNIDLDSMPPTPTTMHEAAPPPHANREPLGQEGRDRHIAISAPERITAEDQALVLAIQNLGAELGDDAPASSLTRARTLRSGAGVSSRRFLQLVDDAAARTRARQDRILKRRRDTAGAANAMPYFFAVLTDLLRPAAADVGPDQRRAERGKCRRRDGRPAPTRRWDSLNGTPERLPITETNAVWRSVLNELALVITVENFNTWLAPTRVLAQEGDLLRVAVPRQFNKDWLEVKLRGRVMNTLARIGYEDVGVEYVVEASA